VGDTDVAWHIKFLDDLNMDDVQGEARRFKEDWDAVKKKVEDTTSKDSAWFTSQDKQKTPAKANHEPTNMDKPKGKPDNKSKRDVIDIDENTIALGSPSNNDLTLAATPDKS